VNGQFGCWRSALVAADLDPFARLGGSRSPWEQDTIIEAMQRFQRIHGRPPMRSDWPGMSQYPSATVVELRFGSWTRAMEAAGLAGSRIRWDRERIIQAIRDHADVHGRPPKSTDWEHRDPLGRWPSQSTVYLFFGNWSRAMQAAGQPLPAVRPRWESDAMIAALRGFAAAHSRAPWIGELGPEHGLPSPGTLAARFGSLEAGFKAAGLQLRRRGEWDREAAIEAIRLFTEEHGHPPTRAQWSTNGELDAPSTSKLERLFGSWSEALVAAGVAAPRAAWDRSRILQAMREWTTQHGHAPTQAQWAPRDPTGRRPSYSVVVRRFESWTAALQEAGVLPASLRRWDHAGAIKAMRSFAREHGRAPTSSDWGQSTAEYPSAGTVSALFGSWSEGLFEAGLDAHVVNWDAEMILVALKEWTELHGRPPQPSEWIVSDPAGAHPTNVTVRKRFGSWDVALRAAGIAIVKKPVWDERRILAAIRKWRVQYDRFPTQKDWKTNDPSGRWPSYAIVVRICGSWPAALRAAGARPPLSARKVSKPGERRTRAALHAHGKEGAAAS
jgi:hypothetical protein